MFDAIVISMLLALLINAINNKSILITGKQDAVLPVLHSV